MKPLRWLDDHFEELLMAVALWAIVVVMGAQVVMRYIFRNSISWSEELSRYFFIWFTFLGISFAVRNHSHIRIDIFETFFPVLKKPLEYIGDAMFLIFCVYMIRPSLSTLSGMIAKGQTSPAMEMPMWIIYCSLVAGFLLTIFRLVQKYVLKLVHRKDVVEL